MGVLGGIRNLERGGCQMEMKKDPPQKNKNKKTGIRKILPSQCFQGETPIDS